MIPTANTTRKQDVIDRIHRIQEQLEDLQQAVQETQDCEHLVIQAHAIEKAVSSLIIEMIKSHLLRQAPAAWCDDPQQTARAVTRLFDLGHR